MSNQPDYSFMKTGTNNVKSGDDPEDTEKNTLAIIVSYAEGAMRTAAKYVSHGNRKGITPEDLKRAMMLEMFFFRNRDDALERAMKTKEELFNENDEKEDGEDDSTDEENDEEDDEEFEENDCKCSLCKCMNTVYTRWEKWEPTTSFECIFKKHIEDMN
jgi:hypothetical protein